MFYNNSYLENVKSLFTKILSLFLAASVLFSTSSFAVDMHFCCNQLVDMAFFGNAEVCKDEVQEIDNPTKQCASFQEKECCDSQIFVKQGDDRIKKTNLNADNENFVFLLVFYTYIDLFQGLEKNIVPFKHYRPPLLSKDIHILHETYLI